MNPTAIVTVCAQPRPDGPGRCAGEIDETGYCGRCGVRDEPSPAAPMVPHARTPATRVRSSAASSPGRAGSSSERRGLRRSLSEEDGDPREALLPDPALPERKRVCRNPRCYEGRTEKGRPRLVEGFCRNCGWGYSFRPPLAPRNDRGGPLPGAGRYRAGGLGWVYLAEDQRIGKYVVLKGLLNTDSAEHRQVALDELRALAAHRPPEHRRRARHRAAPLRAAAPGRRARHRLHRAGLHPGRSPCSSSTASAARRAGTCRSWRPARRSCRPCGR